MREVQQILELWHAAEQRGEETVLATVVGTRGSSYRLPGARLLLTRSGQRAGSISGGCLEDDLIRKAWWMTESGPIIRRYDTTPEGEIGSGYGLGCNGVIHVRVERLLAGQPNVLNVIESVREARQSATFAHAPIEGEDPFVETINPPTRLLIFGAGDDAIPIATLAKYLGWRVAVFDGRAHYARRDKFPTADEVMVRVPGSGRLAIDRWTVAVLMSHSYSQDLAVLEELAPDAPSYLGILGPRKRSLQLLADAGLAESQLAPALHSPMGLDIGADGPEQVALSVLAEIQAVLNGRAGGQLRERPGSIHAREDDGAEQPFRVHAIACA